MRIFSTKASRAELQSLVDSGHSVDVAPPSGWTGSCPTDEMMRGVASADVLLVSALDVVPAPVLRCAEAMRLVIVSAMGVDKIDVDAATSLGIAVARSPSRTSIAGMAEAAIGLMLLLRKRIRSNESKLRAGGWSTPGDWGEALAGSTVGIVGLGSVGSAVARRLAGWDARVVTTNRALPEAAAELGCERLGLPELLRESDCVTLHLPLSPETRHLIGEAQFRLMKPSACFVNTSRGGLVDENALAAALTSGRIFGAALDAFEAEPLAMDSPLRGVDPDRLVLTPHDVGLSRGGRNASLGLAIEQIGEAANGNPPRFTVNPSVRTSPRWRLS